MVRPGRASSKPARSGTACAVRRVDVLITRVRFSDSTPHGISLAQMAKSKSPSLVVLFTPPPEFAEYTSEIGEFIPSLANIADLVEAVHRLTKSPPR